MHWLDNTKQSPSSLDTFPDAHICSLGLHLFLMVALVQSLALMGRDLPVDLPGAAGKQAGGLQWWLNHLLGAREG